MRQSPPPSPPARPQAGNALFLILIAVALFAALSYAVTQSGRGGGSTDKEQSLLLAAQITQQGASLQSAVQRMILTGTPYASLDFCNVPFPFCGQSIGGTRCTSGADCVFAPEGGGATLTPLPTAAIASPGHGSWEADWHLYGPASIGAHVEGVGTAADDLMMLAVDIDDSVCAAINKGLGESFSPLPQAPDGLSIAAAAEITAVVCPDCVGKPLLCVDGIDGGDSVYIYTTFSSSVEGQGARNALHASAASHKNNRPAGGRVCCCA